LVVYLQSRIQVPRNKLWRQVVIILRIPICHMRVSASPFCLNKTE
jgi:hypothetical protein